MNKLYVYTRLIRKHSVYFAIVIGALLAVLSQTLMVQAATCTASVATVTKTSSPNFYYDTPTYLYGYASFKIDTGASGSFSDLWVKIDTFSNSAQLNVAETEDGLYHVGAISSSSSTNVYFYLKGGSVDAAQTYTLRLYEGKPGSGGAESCNSSQSNTGVKDTGSNNANKVSSVTYGAPSIGGTFTMTVIGQTGTIGNAGIFSYSPASLGSWNADCLELRDTTITMSGGNNGTFLHGLYFSALNSSNTNYTLVYTFAAKCVTASTTPVNPLNYISNGANVSHTSVSNYGDLPPIAPASNSLIMTKGINPATSTAGATVTYYLNVTNNGASSAVIDDFTDVLPSSPATVSYVDNSSTFDSDISDGTPATSISNPNSNGQTKVWISTFSVASGKTARLSYQAVIPSTAGSYVNSAVAHIGSTQIDKTVDSTDNVPATATHGVGDINLAGSTKTASDINGGSLQPGEIIEYTINAKNSGNNDATGVQIQDTIDTNTENISNIVIGANNTDCGNNYYNDSTLTAIDIKNVTVKHGSECDITFRVNVKSSATNGTTILNTATITPSEESAVGGSPSSTPLIVRKVPILNITNTEDDADNVVVAGGTINYTITVTNSGQTTASGVDLTGSITGPVSSISSRTFSNCGPSTTYVDTTTGTTLNIAALTITTSNPCVITYSATVTSGTTSGSITNSVDITAAREGGNDPASVSASTLLIGALPDPPNLSISVSDDDVDDIVVPSQSITYTATITNSGQTDATTSLVVTLLSSMGAPTGLTYTNCGSPSGSYSSLIETISSISIPAGNICTIKFTSVVASPLDEGTELTAVFDVATANQGGNNPTPVSSATLTVDATPILGITFTENDDDNIVSADQAITYTLTITNTGNGKATIVGAIDDLIGQAGNYGSYNFLNCGSSYSNNSVDSFDVINLTIAVGTPCVVSYSVIVNTDATGGSSIDNTIDVSRASEGGENPLPVSASSLTVAAMPSLSVTVSEDDVDNSVTPGQTVHYTMIITNNGFDNSTTSATITISSGFGEPTNMQSDSCGSPENSYSNSILSLQNISIAGGTSCTFEFDAVVSSPNIENRNLIISFDVGQSSEGGNNPAEESASTLNVDVTPELAVEISDDDENNIVGLGQIVNMEIAITNNGNGNASGIPLDYELSSAGNNLTNISTVDCGTSIGQSQVGNSLTYSNLQISAGVVCRIRFEFTVDSGASDGTIITQSVDVDSADEGGNSPDTTNASALTVDVSNTAPDIPSNVVSSTLIGGSLTRDLSGASLEALLTDPDNDDQLRYRIQLSTNDNFSGVVIDYRSIFVDEGARSYTYQENEGTYVVGSASTVLADGNYYLRIRAEDIAGANSGWYTVDSIAFRYDTTGPVTPEKPFVIGTVGIGTVTIGWNTNTDDNPHPLIAYRLEHSGDASFTNFTAIDTNDISELLTSLPRNALRYFRVYYRDEAGNLSLPSEVLEVFIPDTPSPPPPEEEPEEEQTEEPTTPTTTPAPQTSLKINSKNTTPTFNRTNTVTNELPKIRTNNQGVQLTTVIIYVRDTNGNPIRGAKVTLYSEPRTAYTDQDGKAIFNNVPIGEHVAVVEYQGKKTSTPVSLNKGIDELKVTLTLQNIVKKKCSWCWLPYLLLLIPLYLYWRYRRRRKKSANHNG